MVLSVHEQQLTFSLNLITLWHERLWQLNSNIYVLLDELGSSVSPRGHLQDEVRQRQTQLLTVDHTNNHVLVSDKDKKQERQPSQSNRASTGAVNFGVKPL